MNFIESMYKTSHFTASDSNGQFYDSIERGASHRLQSIFGAHVFNYKNLYIKFL